MSELVRFIVDAGIATDDGIRGCSVAEIQQLERHLAVRLPAALTECLRVIGHASGNLMEGDTFSVDGFDAVRNVAEEITGEDNAPWRLPEKIIPLLQHDGYEFLFLYADSGDDPPVWHYTETEPTPKDWAPSFTAWLREAAISAIEGKPWNDEVCREIRLHREDWLARKQVLDAYDDEANRIRRAIIRRLVERDQTRGRITGPIEMQEIWNREFQNTDLYGKLRAEGKRIPWGWGNPRDA